MDWIEANGASLRYDLSGDGSANLAFLIEVGKPRLRPPAPDAILGA